MTLDELSRDIIESGLLSAEEVALARGTLPAGAGADALARALMASHKLSRYQASAAFQGRAKALIMGDYRIIDRLGAGGMGQVFKAEHRRMRRIVALKVMSPGALKGDEAVRRFEREVVAAARLAHPNIVVAYDSSEHNGLRYLVSEFVDGPDLAALVKARGPLAVGQAVHCVLQAARGLAYAHDEGIVHRDIKPANLLVDSTKTVKILDMGLARLQGLDDELTGTEQVIGTVDYMSPEQAEGSKLAGPPSDQYSLGCTLWYLLTGRRLYEGESAIERFIKHREAPIPSLSQGRDDVPWALDQAFQRMVAKQPADRFPNMHAVVAALETVRSSSSGLSRLNLPKAQPAPGDSLVGMQPAGGDTAAAIAVPVLQGAEAAASQTKGDADTQHELRRGKLVRPAANRRVAGWPSIRKTLASRTRLVAGVAGAFVLLVVAGFVLWPRKPAAPPQTVAENEPVVAASPKLAMASSPATVARPAAAKPATPAKPSKPPPPTPAPVAPKDRLKVPGPDKGIMLGLVAQPAQLPGVRRWQVDTIAPRGAIYSLSLSPDGSYFALAGRGSGVRIYATRKRRLLGIVPLTQVHFTQVRVAWHPRRPLVAVAGNGLTVVNVNTGIRANLVEAAAWVRSIAWSPDGSKLAAGLNSPVLKTWIVRDQPPEKWHLDDGPRLSSAGVVLPHVAWMPDGKAILFLSNYAAADAWLWTPGGAEPTKLPRAPKGWKLIVPHPVEPQLVGVDEQNHDALYDLQGNRLFDSQTFSRDAIVRDAAWSPDGQRLAVGTSARVVRILMSSGTLVNETAIAGSAAGSPNPTVLVWAADSQQFLAGGEFGTIGCFSGLGIPLWTLAHNGDRSLAMAAASKPNQVATAGDESRVRIWSPAGNVLKTLGAARSTEIAWSPDGLHLATAWDASEELLVWTNPMKAPSPKKLSISYQPVCLAWNPDATRLAVGSSDKQIRLLDASGTEKAKISGLPGVAAAVAWNSTGKMLAASFKDAKTIGLWAADGKLLKLVSKLPGRPLAVAWQPKGTQLACADEEGSVACFDSTGKELWRRTRESAGGRSLAWSPDGLQLALPSNGSAIRIFSTTGQPPIDCQGLNDTRYISWTADGRIIAACEDSVFRCWDAKTARPLWTSVTLGDGATVGFGPGGMPQYASPEKLQGQFVFVLEHEDDRIELVDYAAFCHVSGLAAK